MGFYDDFPFTGGTAGNPSSGNSGQNSYGGGSWDPSKWDWGSTGTGTGMYGNTVYWWKPPGWDKWGLGVEDPFDHRSRKRSKTDDPPRKRRKTDDPPPPNPVVPPPPSNPVDKPPSNPPTGGPTDPPGTGGTDDPVFISPHHGTQLRNMTAKVQYGFPGPFATKKVNAVVGALEHAVSLVYMKPPRGRLFPYAKLRKARIFKPLTLIIGDCMTERNNLRGIDGIDVDGTYEYTSLNVVTSPHAELYKSTTDVAGTPVFKWSNQVYGDICIRSLPASGDGITGYSATNGVDGRTITLADLFAGPSPTNASWQYMASANNRQFMNNDFKDFPYIAPTVEQPPDIELFAKYSSEFVLSNLGNLAIQIECYVFEPKVSSFNADYISPLEYWTDSNKEAIYETVDIENVAGLPDGVVGSSYHTDIGNLQKYTTDLSRSPTMSLSFNQRFKCLDKKTLVCGPGQTMKFRTVLPMSLIRRLDCVPAADVLKGMTHFHWFRCTGAPAYNIANSKYGNSCGSVSIQKFEKVSILPTLPNNVSKVYNLVKTGLLSSDPADIRVQDGNDNVINTGIAIEVDP